MRSSEGLLPERTALGVGVELAWVECAYCKGTGIYRLFGTKCSVCGGTGRVRVREPHHRCALCKGTGVHPGSDPLTCTGCGGKGEVPDPEEPSSTCPFCRGSGRANTQAMFDCPDCKPHSGEMSIVSVLLKTKEIRRSDYSLVGGFVCYDRGLRDELIRIVNILRIALEKGGKPICVLLCGDAGIGKTFFVKQLAAACNAKYVHKDLSSTTNLKDDLDQHILGIALAQPKVVAFLDEVHTIVGGETAYRFVQKPMSGGEYIISGNPVRLTDLIWFFATSRATSPSRLQEVLRAESNQNGVDFVDRCWQPFQIILPSVVSPWERIIKAAAMAKVQRDNLERIAALALFYYAVGSLVMS